MLDDLLENIASLLDKLSVKYMIIGGQAVLLYGEPRLTKDIDVTLGAGAERLNDILDLSKKLKLIPLAHDVKNFVEHTMVLPLKDNVSGLRIDFIFSFTDYEREAIERAKPVKVKKRTVNFASAEDIIIHKIFSGRPRDLEDIRGILKKNKDIGRDYINKWLKVFDESGSDNLMGKFKSVDAE
jgi:predicted nucleotidyltransferase